jgi:hypothetical protein
MDMQDLFPVAITFVALGVLLAFGLSVQTDVRSGFVTNAAGCNSTHTTACGYEYNASRSAIEANSNLSSKLPILGTIVIAAIVVGVLIKAFVFQ